MKLTNVSLATLLLLATTQSRAQELDLAAPSNALREVSSYLDKACTVVQTVGGYADNASSAGTTVQIIENLLGSNTGIGQMIGNGALEVKRVLVNGKFVCTLNEMTNYAAGLVDVSTWRDLGQEALAGALNGNVRDAFGDMDQTELDRNLGTLFTSLKTNVNAFRANVRKISNGYYAAQVLSKDPSKRIAMHTALMTPGSAVNITTANVAGQQAVQNRLNLMIQRQEQTKADEAMTAQTETTAALSADLLGNGMPDQGILNQLDDRAAKAASSRESWEAMTNAMTTGIRSQIVYGERFGQALQNIARTTAMSNYEMTRQAEKEYDQQLADVQATQETYTKIYTKTHESVAQAEDSLAFSWQATVSATTPDEAALNSLLE